MDAFRPTPQQVKFFRTFGYLKVPGLFRDEIGVITRAFEEVFVRAGVDHRGSQRSALIQFVDRHERLRAVLDDPRIEALATALAGEGYNYLDSDGNYYVGDTRWHCDSFHFEHTYLKIAFYLDPLTRDTGALRVVPGSHRVHPYREDLGPLVQNPEEELGVHGRDIPAAALETEPGDVVCFDHTCLHASYGGNTSRRMFTIDVCQRFPDGDAQDLRDYLTIFARKGLERMYGRELIDTAGPRRMRHLEQVLANSGHMPELARQALGAGAPYQTV